MTKPQLRVRPLEHNDISLIADYWLLSDHDFMRSMGVDIEKLPNRENFSAMLEKQLQKPLEQKMAYALIWEVDGKAVGHSNVNGIEYGKQATMHLHLWKALQRRKGMGTELVKQSLPFYFNDLELKALWCEPYALNPAPNKTLEKVGFSFVKRYTTVPGSINFEQEVNQWQMDADRFKTLY